MSDTKTTPEVAHAERSHHPTSPSSLQTLEASPCFLNRNESSEAAERGTKQHESADKGEFSDDLTDAECLAVEATFQAVDQMLIRYGPNAILLRERYWPVDDRLIPDETGKKWKGTTGGFADVVVVSADHTRAGVSDWKFGKWSVEPAENNLQGIAYALGVFKRYPEMLEVTVEFFSPHLEEWTRHTFTRADVPRMLLRVTATAERAKAVRIAIAADENNVKHYSPTTSACTFCARVGFCPAITQFGFTLGKKYAPLEVEAIEKDVRGFALTDPKVAHAGLQLWGILGKGAAEYRRRVTERAVENADYIPQGYTLSMSYPRKVIDLDLTIKVAEQYLPAAAVRDMLSLPITTVEKAIAAKAPRGSKESTVEEFGAKLEACGAVQASPSPTIKLMMKNESKTKTE